MTSKNDTIEEGAKAGNFEPLHIKHGKTLMESCVYCGQSHVEEYLCLKAGSDKGGFATSVSGNRGSSG